MTPGDTSLPSVLVPKADFLESLQRWAVTSLLFHQAQPKPPQPGNSYSISVSHCSPGGPRKEREGQQDEQASAKDTEALVASRNLPAACRELQQRPPCPCLPPPGRLGSSGSPCATPLPQTSAVAAHAREALRGREAMPDVDVTCPRASSRATEAGRPTAARSPFSPLTAEDARAASGDARDSP